MRGARAIAVLAAAVALGCGGGGSEVPPAGELLPLAVGHRWTFRVTDVSDGATGTKTQTVVGQTRLSADGPAVFVLETNKPNGGRTRSYQLALGDDVVRFEEETYGAGGLFTGKEVYGPSKLRCPQALRLPGDRRVDSYNERTYDGLGNLQSELNKTEDWTVEAVEALEVPAGRFEGVVRMRRSSRTTASNKTYWFAPGVGKVKEAGDGQVEELSAYELSGG